MTRITVDPARTLGQLDRKVFGGFVEHLGRCIYGGMYEEGSPLADGAGSCVWHEFSHTPGTIYQGQTGDVAADHYHRWPQDVALMKQLGLNSYRFSIRWPRILPEGTGEVNRAGVAFYDRLVDSLLEATCYPLKRG